MCVRMRCRKDGVGGDQVRLHDEDEDENEDDGETLCATFPDTCTTNL